MRRALILSSLLPALGCAIGAAAAPAPGDGPSASTMRGGRRPALVRRDCLLTVDGRVAVKGRCLVAAMGDGGYTLNAWSRGKPRRSHFAMVSADGDGSATVTWNADPDDDRALDPLGKAILRNGCWQGDRVRICAR